MQKLTFKQMEDTKGGLAFLLAVLIAGVITGIVVALADH